VSRILFITSTRLGDAVLSTGLLARLLADHPEARTTIACGPIPAPLFRSVPGLDRVIEMPKRRFAAHWFALWSESVGTRWDLVVDLRDSAVSRLVRARRRLIYRAAVPPRHKVVDVSALLDARSPAPPRLWVDEEARDGARHLLSDVPAGRPMLAIAPTANWRGKEWPADRFSALVERLTRPSGALAGAAVVVLGAEAERERAVKVIEGLGDRAVDLVGRTDPPTAAAVLERAALFVGNDSGLMHIASAVGAPTIGLFGPGYPEVYGPWGPNARRVVSRGDRDELARRGRAEPGSLDLMDGVSIDDVERAADDLVRRKSAPFPIDS